MADELRYVHGWRGGFLIAYICPIIAARLRRRSWSLGFRGSAERDANLLGAPPGSAAAVFEHERTSIHGTSFPQAIYSAKHTRA